MRIKTKGLTKREKDALEYIILFINNNSFPPSIREICKGLKVSSPATVKVLLDGLESKKYISKFKNCSRTIKVLKGVEEND